MADDFKRPMPRPTPTSEPFWQGLAANQVRLQKCNDCEKWIFYPRSHCPGCLSDHIEWHEVSGEGSIYSFTVARRPTAPQFKGMEPQFIAVVELNEGGRMNSVIVNAEESDLGVGVKVKPLFDRGQGEHTLLFFEPADA